MDKMSCFTCVLCYEDENALTEEYQLTSNDVYAYEQHFGDIYFNDGYFDPSPNKEKWMTLIRTFKLAVKKRKKKKRRIINCLQLIVLP